MREMKGYEVIDIIGEELGEEYPRDKYVDDAKTDVLEFFNERKIETFYLKQIILFFETQIYPLGQEDLVDKIKKDLNLPVICSKAIPEGIINRFMKWHKTRVNSNQNHKERRKTESRRLLPH